jgi:DNA primase
LEKKKREEDKEGITKPQKLLLTWLSTDITKFRRIKDIITPEDFSPGFCRTVAEMVFDQFWQDGKVNPAKIINQFEDKDEQNMAAALFSTEFREEMDAAGQKKAFEDTVRKVKQASIEQRIEQAVETGDMERFQTLLMEKNRYKNQFPIPD